MEGDVLRAAVQELLDDYHDDHNWAREARHKLSLALHQEDGCPSYRKDCEICTTALRERIGLPASAG